MNRSRLPILIVLAVLCAVPAVALGDVPSAQTSSTPSIVRLVGSVAGVPDAGAGRFTVIVRKLSGQTMASAVVDVVFSECPDVVLCADQLDPSSLQFCGAKSVRKTTGAGGSVTFTLLGGSTGAGHAGSIGGTARIYADGVLLRSLPAAVYDLDGQGGVTAADLSVWLGDFASGQPWSRADYDGDGTVGAGDLALWLAEFASGTSVESCAATCP